MTHKIATTFRRETRTEKFVSIIVEVNQILILIRLSFIYLFNHSYKINAHILKNGNKKPMQY